MVCTKSRQRLHPPNQTVDPCSSPHVCPYLKDVYYTYSYSLKVRKTEEHIIFCLQYDRSALRHLPAARPLVKDLQPASARCASWPHTVRGQDLGSPATRLRYLVRTHHARYTGTQRIVKQRDAESRMLWETRSPSAPPRLSALVANTHQPTHVQVQSWRDLYSASGRCVCLLSVYVCVGRGAKC